METTHKELINLQLHSSEVEELEKNSPVRINRLYIDNTTLKVVFYAPTYRRGTAGRYNSKENILFFADEVHMQTVLQQSGLNEKILDEFIVDLTIVNETKIVKEKNTVKDSRPPRQFWYDKDEQGEGAPAQM